MTVGETEVLPDVPLAVKPVPVQLVAFVLLHVSVEDCPDVIDVGFAERVAAGTAGAVADVVEIWMTLSPAFSGYRVMRQRQAFADPS